MAKISLRRESGEFLRSIDGFKETARIAERVPKRQLRCLGYLDFWGVTIFNRVQCKAIIQDLEEMRPFCRSDEERALLEDVKALAVRCAEGQHLSLWFIAD